MWTGIFGRQSQAADYLTAIEPSGTNPGDEGNPTAGGLRTFPFVRDCRCSIVTARLRIKEGLF